MNQLPQNAEDKDARVESVGKLRTLIDDEYDRKYRRPKMDQTRVRTTFLLDRELSDRLNALKAIHGHGWKTIAFNNAIAALLKEYESTLPE